MEFASVMDFALTVFLILALAAMALVLFTGCYVCIEMRDEIREWRKRGGDDGEE